MIVFSDMHIKHSNINFLPLGERIIAYNDLFDWGVIEPRFDFEKSCDEVWDSL